MNFIIDTNVFVRACFDTKSYSFQAIINVVENYNFFYSKEVLEEVKSTLNKDRLKNRLTQEKKDFIINMIEDSGIKIKPISNIKICRDENDDIFLNLANDIEATAIITEDKDLLILHPYKNTQIITSEQFIKSFL